MTTDKPYPECLSRPDAGGHVQSRTARTERRYRERFAGMIRTLCKRKGWTSASAHDLAIDIGERDSQYAGNTLKQYHAAIRQTLRDNWDAGEVALEAIVQVDAILRAHRPAPTSKKVSTAKTSARRAKSVRPEQISAMTAALLLDPTPIRQITAAMLDYGVELMTRPGEFLTLGQDPAGRFWVRSAKYSEGNRRGLQAARVVPTDLFDASEISELQNVVALIKAERARGATFARLLRRCQHAIRQARDVVGGRSRRLTAYSVRHQARANYVAMGLSVEEVAVLMGHASAGTAQSHYSPGRCGWRGMAGLARPDVDPIQLSRVRPAHPSRGWEQARRWAAGPSPSP